MKEFGAAPRKGVAVYIATKSDSCWLMKAQQVKAMFRKAQALENMPSEKYEEAIDVIREVRESLNAELERLSKSGERGESGDTQCISAMRPANNAKTGRCLRCLGAITCIRAKKPPGC